MVGSWDEMTSWKCVMPMCTYVSAKRKKDSGKSKKKGPYRKQYGSRTADSYGDGICYSDSHRRSKNLLYSSTGVSSYDAPNFPGSCDTKKFANSLSHRIDSVQEKAKGDADMNRENQMKSSPLDRPNEKCKRSERNELTYLDQMKFANIKLSLRNSVLMDNIKSAKPKSKRNLSHMDKSITDGQREDERTRLEEPQYDNELIKIRTLCLPPVEPSLGRCQKKVVHVDKESEDGGLFPFRISRVSDGRSVSQTINIDNMATYIIDQRNNRKSSETREDKGICANELPPLAGLYIS